MLPAVSKGNVRRMLPGEDVVVICVPSEAFHRSSAIRLEAPVDIGCGFGRCLFGGSDTLLTRMLLAHRCVESAGKTSVSEDECFGQRLWIRPPAVGKLLFANASYVPAEHWSSGLPARLR